MSMLIWIIIGVAVLGGAILLVVAGVRAARNRGESDPLMARLEEATQRGDVVTSLEQIEMQQPFTQRVLVPLLQRIGELSTGFTPQKVLEDTTRKLEIAGNPGRIDAATFLASRFVVAIFFGGILLMVGLFSPNHWPLGQTFLVVLVFTLLGFFFPQLWLQSRINSRQKEIRKAMPDALDLLTICVEAGLGFEAAMAKVSEKWENQLSFALLRAIREIQLGKARRDAMRDMAERIGIPEMTSFVAAIIQSEILGVSLAKVLRIQSDQMRVRRRQLAEEQAHQAPVKMILPLAFLIFPSIFIILLTPAGIQLSKSFGNIGGP
ncbi:MAG TPA: type II secretion system F family protein [Anaerolineales bacterium]|nr:type II secretion system F family protein [Anaerolineales bacterium]